MDVALFVIGASIGVTAGLICRRNDIHVFQNYYFMDMGAIGKRSYYEKQVIS